LDESEVKELVSKGRFNEALQNIKAFQKNENLSGADQLRWQVFKSQILSRIGRFEEGLKIAEKVLKECQDQNLTLLMVDASIATVEALESLGTSSKGLKIIATGSERLSAIGDEHPAAINQKKVNFNKWYEVVFLSRYNSNSMWMSSGSNANKCGSTSFAS
jgi:hypothetical protein